MTINNMILATILFILGETKLLNCANQHDLDKLSAITLTKKMPIVEYDNSINMIESSYNVYYHSNFIMYEFLYEFDSLVENQVVLQEMRNFFVVFHKDSSYGYKYFPNSNVNLDHNKRTNIDSELSSLKFESNIYDTLINYKPDSFYNHKDEVIRVYKNPPSANSVSKEIHDLYFYYTKKLKDVPETFSRKMDNIKGMKLSKILIKVSGGYYKEFNMTFPPRELLQEMKELTIENKDEILNYFKKYKASSL